MPIIESDLASLSGGNVVTTSGDKIGSIGQIYLDDQTGEPTFGAGRRYAGPTSGSARTGGPAGGI